MGPTKAEINHANIAHNFRLIREAVHPAKIMSVVKADAYGHGSVPVAQTLLKAGTEYLGVAFAEEGIELRQAGIAAPILVFGAQLDCFFEQHLKHDLEITISRTDQIEPLQYLCKQLNKQAKVHIKIDSGMGRVGFMFDSNLQPIIDLLNDEWIEVVGVYSHLSSADELDLSNSREQVERFRQVQVQIKTRTNKPILFHLANSAAIMRLPEAWFDMVRPGVMLYGNPPSPDFETDWPLKEGMRFISRVAAIKDLAAGHPVSYNRRFHTPETGKIAIIPAGYADGYNRKMTNVGQVLIRGQRFPVAGTVCMDQFMAWVGTDKSIKPGDEVVLFGKQEKEHISIIEVSKTLTTIPYEVTCWVSQRVPRVHIKE